MCETDDGSFVQAGIVAVGIGCGDEIPGLYVNVATYVCWIKEIVEKVSKKHCLSLNHTPLQFQVEGRNTLPYNDECTYDFHCTEQFCTKNV